MEPTMSWYEILGEEDEKKEIHECEDEFCRGPQDHEDRQAFDYLFEQGKKGAREW